MTQPDVELSQPGAPPGTTSALPAGHHLGRRRRPTGAPPPLPRTIGRTGQAWLALLVVLLIWVPAALNITSVRRVADRQDSAFLQQVAHLRTAWLSDVAEALNGIGSGWALTAVGAGTIVALLVFRRWRHLFTLVGSLLVLQFVVGVLYDSFARPRPYSVTMIGPWRGWSMPSPTTAILATVMVGVAYTLVVPGNPRTVAKGIIAVVLGAFVGSRLYLGIDHPSDVIVGTTLGIAIPLLAFRLFTPNEVFPVHYGGGKTAHLDVGGRRGEAIRMAIEEQLGLTISDVGHIGLAGSGGSTPLRLQVQGGSTDYLFAKLYAMNHVRADRWYKLGRTILYGRLEDESPYQSVRRLVEYEDYAFRLFQDVGIPTAASYGVVELTPEREYVLVTEFFDGAHEIGEPEVEVDDGVIDEALRIVRLLWDAGLAHRDIKPANLLVRDGHVFLIDVAFAQVRPSPWRQAVDLANMMLVLAVRTDPERVYERALRLFTADDIAEAFAAARGIASPSQLRAVMKQDGRDLLTRFRELAPERQPIALQRWSPRRLALVAVLVVGTLFAVAQVASLLAPARDVPVKASPKCSGDDLMTLIAQSVPSATLLPCIATLPAGWELERVHVARGRTRFWLDSDRAGEHALEVRLERPDHCDVDDAVEVPSDEPGTERFERPERTSPSLRSVRYYRFPGGCVTYVFDFDKGATAGSIFEGDQAISFVDRAHLVENVADEYDLQLCGAGEQCPGGNGH